MISYTLRNYLELTQFINLNELAVLREPNVPYLLTNTNKYNRHDKIFRKLLANKIEMKKLLKEESEIEQLLDNNELERYDTKYITKGYEDRQADIVYKLKEAITYLKKSKTGGEGIMHVHEVLRRDEEKAKKKALNEGLIQVAKNMLKEKLDVDFISKVTGLSKEQFLEK